MLRLLCADLSEILKFIAEETLFGEDHTSFVNHL